MREEERGGGEQKFNWANSNNYYMTHPTSAAMNQAESDA